jgi:hypothetical protein
LAVQFAASASTLGAPPRTELTLSVHILSASAPEDVDLALPVET